MTSEAVGSKPTQRTYHYCIVRRDLPLGVISAQLVHAAGESVIGWVPPKTHAVVLAAKDEAHLAKIERQLRRRDILHTAIREPDEPWEGALMAIGISPLTDRKVLRPITGKLKLL